VVLRKQGEKTPLFCVHSGGGHVFFYNLLTEYIKPNRPIYALQPSGLFGEDNMHGSIEEMTADYIKAMRAVQPAGPYNVLVYCFSATIGNEMAIQLEKVGQKINIIVMDTMASPWTLNTPLRIKARLGAFVIRLFKNPIKSIWLFFVDRFWRISPLWVKLFGDDDEKDLEKLKINLRKICLAYDWKGHTGNVSLILTEKPNELLQKVTIDSWKELTTGGVETILTKGTHRTLFEEPDIQYVSEKIDKCIVEQ
jgi:thioesterase domain-containing protein